jgi:hypothetical protein
MSGSNLGFWRERARRTIDQVRADAKRAGLTPEETLKRIDAAYPFGERDHYPYKAWLTERTIARVELGLAGPETIKTRDLVAERKREEHDRLLAEGQQSLF